MQFITASFLLLATSAFVAGEKHPDSHRFRIERRSHHSDPDSEGGLGGGLGGGFGGGLGGGFGGGFGGGMGGGGNPGGGYGTGGGGYGSTEGGGVGGGYGSNGGFGGGYGSNGGGYGSNGGGYGANGGGYGANGGNGTPNGGGGGGGGYGNGQGTPPGYGTGTGGGSSTGGAPGTTQGGAGYGPYPNTGASTQDFYAFSPYVYLSSFVVAQDTSLPNMLGVCRCDRPVYKDGKMTSDSSEACIQSFLTASQKSSKCLDFNYDSKQCTVNDPKTLADGDKKWWEQAFCKACVDAKGISDPQFACPDGYQNTGVVGSTSDFTGGTTPESTKKTEDPPKKDV